MAAAAILNSDHCAIFDTTDAFYIGFAAFPPNLMRIGPVVKKWQQFYEIQDGGEFW